ncbi:MAG: mevalonate kinase [Thermoplasmata archaeon]
MFSETVFTASAPGKLIMFGEHFVVYGLPSIAAAIDSRTTATVERSAKYELIDNRPETPGYKKEKARQQADSIERMFRAMGIYGKPVRIVLSGDLVAASGVGASAASCSAIAAALNAEFNLGMSLDRINDVAYEGEKGYHGTPSGIDNSCSTYGGFIRFQKDFIAGKNRIEPIEFSGPLTVVVGNTGITSNTAKVVEGVKNQKSKEPERFERIFEEYLRIESEAESALRIGDLNKVGSLMNKNHELLRDIGVSCPELETLVEIARRNGALGAKLTGTGKGGLMIALVTDDTKEQVARAIERAGYKSQITDIGAEGVKIV